MSVFQYIQMYTNVYECLQTADFDYLVGRATDKETKHFTTDMRKHFAIHITGNTV